MLPARALLAQVNLLKAFMKGSTNCMQKLSVRGTLTLVVIMLMLVTGNFACAQDEVSVPVTPVPFPAIYYGSVAAEDGTAVDQGVLRAYAGSELCGALAFSGGEFGKPEEEPYVQRLLVYSSNQELDGKEIIFRVLVDGKEHPATIENGSVIWKSGEKREVKLVMSAEPAPFWDLQEHWAFATVVQLVDKGIISGYEDYTFRPDHPITRAEISAILARAMALPPGNIAMLAGYSDAPDLPVWAKGAVASALEAGLLKGYPGEDGSSAIQPADNITRTELAVILGRALTLKTGDRQAQAKDFTDQDQIPAWAMEGVNLAAHKELIKGYPDGSFRPESEVTRAEAAMMVARLMENVDEQVAP